MERDRAEPIWVSQSGNSQATVRQQSRRCTRSCRQFIKIFDSLTDDLTDIHFLLI